ncbi:MAG: hypothetical protein AAB645_02725, partial [Patescibacteria group bacterium]
MSSKTIVNLTITAIIIVIIYFGYQYFTSANPDQVPVGGVAVVAVGSTDFATSSPADEFRQLLASINSVDFEGDHSIFNNPIFMDALEDFSQPLPAIDSGRDNPFAPLGKDALSALHQATSSRINISTSSSPNKTPVPTGRPLPRTSGAATPAPTRKPTATALPTTTS